MGLRRDEGVAYFVVMYHFINLLMSAHNNILVLYFMLYCTGAASGKLPCEAVRCLERAFLLFNFNIA